MLGTNDTKDRFYASAACIGIGMARLVKKAMATECWGGKKPNILVVAPPHIGEEMEQSAVMPAMGLGCAAKSRELAKHYAVVAQNQGCAFLDAEGVAEFNEVDYMHLTRKGHAQLAAKLAEIVPTLV